MLMDYAESLLELISTIIAFVICLFGYIDSKKTGWVYLAAFFSCSLMSSYFWTTSLLVMGDYPNASNLLTYWGWNASYLALVLVAVKFEPLEDKRYFHFLMLLPIPLNLYQLFLYLPYGGILNSTYEVVVNTVAASLCIQKICWYWKKGSGAKRPYMAVAVLLFVCFEFGMWTSSAIQGPMEKAYYPCAILRSLDFFFMVWAAHHYYKGAENREPAGAAKRTEDLLKHAVLTVVLICSIGGGVLAEWMKEKISAGMQGESQPSVYEIIPVVLFVFSLFIVMFAAVIIFVVGYQQKAAESQQLREEKAVAQHASEAKSEFLANMSHEIRTPINTVLGMNEMIKRESLRGRKIAASPAETDALDNISSFAGNIESAGNNLLAIINDILDFSKIEAGQMDIVPGEYQLSSVLNDLNNTIWFRAQEAGLIFEVDVDETLPNDLYGDVVRVRQILSNLLTNAVKYTHQGSVLLRVRGEAEKLQPGETITLIVSVQDTGIGICKEDIEKLFMKFQRVDLDRNSTIEGTGLGLAITQNLVSMMGGEISIESVYGAGSTFTVTIPQEIVSVEPIGDFRYRFDKNPWEEEIYEETFHAPAANMLAVDDTSLNLAVVIGLLKKTGIRIDAVTSGEKAVEMARVKAYDLILMDQRMPEMDGTQALQQIRQNPDGLNHKTPVICLTADAVIGAKERYLADGFNDYLPKPINGETLERMLIRYLPKDKVSIVRKVDAGKAMKGAAAEIGAEDFYEVIREADVEPELGLSYCQGDRELYHSVLQEFVQEGRKKSMKVRSSCIGKDWKEYAINVHALKSSARMIGARSLAESAARMEEAANRGDEETIRKHHMAMVGQYKAVAGSIEALFGEIEAREDEDDNEILEFFPEE